MYRGGELTISLPDRHTPRTAPARDDALAARQAAAESHRQQASREVDAAASGCARPLALAGLLPDSIAGDARPMEPRPRRRSGSRRDTWGAEIFRMSQCSNPGCYSCYM